MEIFKKSLEVVIPKDFDESRQRFIGERKDVLRRRNDMCKDIHKDHDCSMLAGVPHDLSIGCKGRMRERRKK